MKKLIIFIVITTALIIGLDQYFEYCVNREIELWIAIVAGVVVLVGVIFYIKYLVKLVTEFLNLK